MPNRAPDRSKLTKFERGMREILLYNAAQELSYRVGRLNEAEEEGLSKSILTRRRREMIKACETLISVGTARMPDTAIAHLGGPEEVERRDALLGAGGTVTPLKRNGRPTS
jgi:hypothetical protein